MAQSRLALARICAAATFAGICGFWTQAIAQAAPPSLEGVSTVLGKLDPDAPLHKTLPPEIARRQEIVAGIILGEPPSQFVDPADKQLKGADIEMIQALSRQLGVPFRVVPTEYGAFVAGLQAQRFDMVAAFIADTVKRQAVVDFVDDYATMDLAMAHKDSAVRIGTLDDLCGRSLAIDQGHYLVPQMQKQAETCKADGKPVLRIDIYRDGPSSQLAVKTRRSEVIISSGATALYAVKASNGELKIVSGAIGEPVLVGYVFPKASTALRDSVKGAFAAIMASGENRRILANWGLESGALDRPYVNEGPNAAAILGKK